MGPGQRHFQLILTYYPMMSTMFPGHQSWSPCKEGIKGILYLKLVSEYDQEIPQSQAADKPMHHEEAPHNHQDTAGRQTKESYQLSLPHQDDCKTRMKIKYCITKHKGSAVAQW